MPQSDTPSKIGESLQALLDASGLNPNALSKAVHLPRSSVYSMLHKTTMQVDMLELKVLADFFGVGLDYFLPSSPDSPVPVPPYETVLLRQYRVLSQESREQVLRYIDALAAAQKDTQNNREGECDV